MGLKFTSRKKHEICVQRQEEDKEPVEIAMINIYAPLPDLGLTDEELSILKEEIERLKTKYTEYEMIPIHLIKLRTELNKAIAFKNFSPSELKGIDDTLRHMRDAIKRRLERFEKENQ